MYKDIHHSIIQWKDVEVSLNVNLWENKYINVVDTYKVHYSAESSSRLDAYMRILRHLKGITLSLKSDLYLITIYISVKYTLKSNNTYIAQSLTKIYKLTLLKWLPMVRKRTNSKDWKRNVEIKIREDPIYIPILFPDINCKEGLNTLWIWVLKRKKEWLMKEE